MGLCGNGFRPAGRARVVVAVLAPTPLLAAAIPARAAVAPTGHSARVQVSADGTWTSTGLHVRAGDLIRIAARGSWTDGQTTSGPAGSATRSADNFFNVADLGVCQFCATTKTVQWGALIGYIGSSPPEPGSYASASVRAKALKIFYVGGHYVAEARHTGTLWLDKNADAYSNFTSDNHGHVTARVSVSPPETAGQTRVRALAAVGSINVLEPLKQATKSCVYNALHDIRNSIISIALENAGLKRGADLVDGVEITGDGIDVFEETRDGHFGNAEFSFAKVITGLVGEVPERRFQLFSLLGGPAIDCVEAGLWLDGNIGGQIGKLLRQKFLTPRVEDARIGGNWTLIRNALACRNFPAGCATTPLHVRFRHCTATRCVMSRPRSDVFWRHPHAITRHGDVWSAKFRDIAIECRTRLNPANVTVRLRVIKASGHGGLATATALSGTYTVDASANPPNCEPNGHGEQGLHGTR